MPTYNQKNENSNMTNTSDGQIQMLI